MGRLHQTGIKLCRIVREKGVWSLKIISRGYATVLACSSPRHSLLDHVNNALQSTQPLLLFVTQEQLYNWPSVNPASLFVAHDVRARLSQQGDQHPCLGREDFFRPMDEEPPIRRRSFPPPSQVLVVSRRHHCVFRGSFGADVLSAVKAQTFCVQVIGGCVLVLV